MAPTEKTRSDTLHFRPATREDAETLLGWRNDPLTRAMSHTQNRVERATHVAWLDAVLADPNTGLYLCTLNSREMGTLRVQREAGCSVLSWTVAPTYRGRGLGSRMLATFIQQFPDRYRAEIKTQHVASQRMAVHSGLSFVGTLDGIDHYDNFTLNPPHSLK